MLSGAATNGGFNPERDIQFRCDGGAKFVNFKFNPTSSKVCKSGTKTSTWSFFCNEVENGASMGAAYEFIWTDNDGNKKDSFIYSNRDFSANESGLLNGGVFTIQLNSIIWAAYKDNKPVSPGAAKYTMGLTVWSI